MLLPLREDVRARDVRLSRLWICSISSIMPILIHAYYGYRNIIAVDMAKNTYPITYDKLKRILELWEFYGQPYFAMFQQSPKNAAALRQLFDHIPERDRLIYLECLGGVKIGHNGQSHCTAWYPWLDTRHDVARQLLAGPISELILLKSMVPILLLIFVLYVDPQNIVSFVRTPPRELHRRIVAQFMEGAQKACRWCLPAGCGSSKQDSEVHQEKIRQRCQLARKFVPGSTMFLILWLILIVLSGLSKFPLTSFDHGKLAGSSSHRCKACPEGYHFNRPMNLSTDGYFSQVCFNVNISRGAQWTNVTDRQPQCAIQHPGNTLAQFIIGSGFVPVGFACLVFLAIKKNMRTETVPIPTCLNVANVLLSAMWVWTLMTLHQDWYEALSVFIWPFRIMQGIAFGNSSLTLGLHAFVTISDLLAFIRHGLGDANYTLGYVNRQGSMFLLAAVMTYGFENTSRVQAETLIELKRTNCSRAAVQRLLSALCDCIVHLDGSLNISEPCPHLASLLLRPSSAASFISQPFAKLLHHDDEERFTHHVEEEMRLQSYSDTSSTDSLLARPFHVNLLDANGVLVPVQLFCSFVRDMDSCFYLLGIREEIDVLHWRPPNDAADNGTNNTGLATLRVCPQIDELSCTVSSNDKILSIVDEDVCETLGIPEGAAAVWINPNTCDLKFVRANMNFSLQGGQLWGYEAFASMLPDEASVCEFYGNVQKFINLVFRTESEIHHGEFQHIVLVPFSDVVGTYRMSISAQYMLVCDKTDFQNPQDDLPLLCVVLKDITEMFQKVGRRRGYKLAKEKRAPQVSSDSGKLGYRVML